MCVRICHKLCLFPSYQPIESLPYGSISRQQLSVESDCIGWASDGALMIVFQLPWTRSGVAHHFMFGSEIRNVEPDVLE